MVILLTAGFEKATAFPFKILIRWCLKLFAQGGAASEKETRRIFGFNFAFVVTLEVRGLLKWGGGF